MILSTVFPVHNEAGLIAALTQEFVSAVEKFDFKKLNVILVENGSSDRSAHGVSEYVQSFSASGEVCVHGITDLPAGLGFAYAAGIEKALHLESDADHWIMLSALDLPFGISDLESFVTARKTTNAPAYIGSKAHPHSIIKRSLLREWLSIGFRYFRLFFFGMRTGDTQGVFFVQAHVLRNVVSKIQARDFFYTTELVYLLERQGSQIIEVPIVFAGERRKSSVRIFRHGKKVLAGLWRLKWG